MRNDFCPQIGDRVRFRQWDDMVQEFGFCSDKDVIPCRYNFCRGMESLCGTAFIITEILRSGVVRGHETPWNVSFDMLEFCDADLQPPVATDAEFEGFLFEWTQQKKGEKQ